MHDCWVLATGRLAPTPTVFLLVALAWLTLEFFLFGMFAPRNAFVTWMRDHCSARCERRFKRGDGHAQWRAVWILTERQQSQSMHHSAGWFRWPISAPRKPQSSGNITVIGIMIIGVARQCRVQKGPVLRPTMRECTIPA